MRIVTFTLVLLVLISCSQKRSKENVTIDSLSKSLTVDTVEITDSTRFDNYSVEIDTAYLYARADSNAKMTTYLTKNELAVICKKNGEFGYAVRLTDSTIEPKGWLKLKYLKQIFFTPPKISKE